MSWDGNWVSNLESHYPVLLFFRNGVCKLDGKCGVQGKGKGLIKDECEHVSDCDPGMDIL